MDLRTLLLLVGLVGVRADDASAWDVTPPDAFCVLHGAHLCVGDYHTHVNQDETTFSAVALGRSTFAAPTCGTRVPTAGDRRPQAAVCGLAACGQAAVAT